MSRLDSCEALQPEVNNNTEKINISEFLSLKTLLPPALPKVGSEFALTVSYAVSPDNFVILPQPGASPSSPNQLPGLPELRVSMLEYYETGPGQHQRLEDSRLDRFAAAKLNNADWHR